MSALKAMLMAPRPLGEPLLLMAFRNKANSSETMNHRLGNFISVVASFRQARGHLRDLPTRSQWVS
ncbi:hypothetical protein [Amycolatopsis orientalis]|uniref:hypothetical protein n=1 Tax=Amycolatopsis orientalis TaxID=31958 RepID=UPI001268FBAE|nr:hypothetical protein [Amycolatopsis orientalis]